MAGSAGGAHETNQNQIRHSVRLRRKGRCAPASRGAANWRRIGFACAPTVFPKSVLARARSARFMAERARLGSARRPAGAEQAPPAVNARCVRRRPTGFDVEHYRLPQMLGQLGRSLNQLSFDGDLADCCRGEVFALQRRRDGGRCVTYAREPHLFAAILAVSAGAAGEQRGVPAA
jgi:hypothetical protein